MKKYFKNLRFILFYIGSLLTALSPLFLIYYIHFIWIIILLIFVSIPLAILLIQTYFKNS